MTTRNPSLDVLRGIAILLVVLFHCAYRAPSIVPGLSGISLYYGPYGVNLFFMVSGYTMMLRYGPRNDPAAAGAFYLRRAFRIVPLFWIAIAFYLVTSNGEGSTAWAPDGVSMSDVVRTVFFLHLSSLTAFNSVVPGGWSIGIEMQFYLVFPLLIRLFRQPNGPTICYGLIALISLSASVLADLYLVPQLSASFPPEQQYLAVGFYYCWLPRQAICFGLGILLYDIIERGSRPLLGAVFLFATCLTSLWGTQLALIFAVAYVLLRYRMTSKVIGLLGRHSYAIYLVHFVVVSAVEAWLPVDLVPRAALVAGLSLALSYFLIEPLIERPFNRLGSQLAARTDRKRNSAIAV